MRSPICNASEYVEELQRCTEMRGVQCTGSYSDNLQHKNVLTCCSFDLSPLYPTTCSLFMKTQLSVCLMLGARAKKKVGFKLLSVGFIEKGIPLSTKVWSITMSPSNCTLCMFFH